MIVISDAYYALVPHRHAYAIVDFDDCPHLLIFGPSFHDRLLLVLQRSSILSQARPFTAADVVQQAGAAMDPLQQRHS